MREDAPIHEKKPFGYPFPAEALDMFVHPGGEFPEFHAPFTHEGAVYAANGFMALRLQKFAFAPPPANPSAAKRVMELFPWGAFEGPEMGDDNPRWASLDDASLSIWKFGPRPIWERSLRTYHVRIQPGVRVGAGAVTALPLLQLLARLPRARVWTDNGPRGAIICRFNGGEAIIRPFPDFVEGRMDARFGILGPKRSHHDGRPEFDKPKGPPDSWLKKHYKPAAEIYAANNPHADDLPVIVRED